MILNIGLYDVDWVDSKIKELSDKAEKCKDDTAYYILISKVNILYELKEHSRQTFGIEIIKN